MVDLQPVERLIGNVPGDHAIPHHLREIAHAAENAVGNARRAAAAAGDLICAGGLNGYAEDTGASLHDAAKLFRSIQLQPEIHAEAVTQRCGELTGAGRGADEREFRQIDAYRAR